MGFTPDKDEQPLYGFKFQGKVEDRKKRKEETRLQKAQKLKIPVLDFRSEVRKKFCSKEFQSLAMRRKKLLA